MKTLFNEYEAQNEDGYNLAQEIEMAIHPVIVKYWKSGFPFREIYSIICLTISTVISELILRNAMDMRKKERMQR